MKNGSRMLSIPISFRSKLSLGLFQSLFDFCCLLQFPISFSWFPSSKYNDKKTKKKTEKMKLKTNIQNWIGTAKIVHFAQIRYHSDLKTGLSPAGYWVFCLCFAWCTLDSFMSRNSNVQFQMSGLCQSIHVNYS